MTAVTQLRVRETRMTWYNERQNSPVLQNPNQCGDKNNRAEHAEENKRQALFTHAAEDKIAALSREAQQCFKETTNGTYHRQAAGGVQEKPAKRGFHQ